MDPEFALNAVDALLTIGVAIPCLYMATRLKQPNLRLLTFLLSGFLLVHGVYHATSVLGALPGLDVLGELSDLVVEPLGWVLFLLFAVFLVRYSR